MNVNYEIDYSKLPKTEFDLPYLGSNLNKEKIENITSVWGEADFQKFAAKFPHFVKEVKKPTTPPLSEKSVTDKK